MNFYLFFYAVVSTIVNILLIKSLIDQKNEYNSNIKNIEKSLRKSINDISIYAEKEK